MIDLWTNLGLTNVYYSKCSCFLLCTWWFYRIMRVKAFCHHRVKWLLDFVSANFVTVDFCWARLDRWPTLKPWNYRRCWNLEITDDVSQTRMSLLLVILKSSAVVTRKICLLASHAQAQKTKQHLVARHEKYATFFESKEQDFLNIIIIIIMIINGKKKATPWKCL